ncbi:hypothetical protein [Rhizobium sp. LC145]|uniref:hypothetical protein n=1 Tax=Rhizobium sp. LC145 TaxID=1120688 RepID=UPI000629E94E|nr:hypothetical protein [Rhizobium sp. LC145]KKX33971.1 hypothetical protein YH62_02020 [Rhizobium sp. LC145]TKT67063.1 hypothetical protein FDR95_05135 [Rhizobiaceae bacterium LC148]
MGNDGRNEIVDGSVVKLIKGPQGWRLEIQHKDGGVSGPMAPFETLEDVTGWIKGHYNVK